MVATGGGFWKAKDCPVSVTLANNEMLLFALQTPSLRLPSTCSLCKNIDYVGQWNERDAPDSYAAALRDLVAEHSPQTFVLNRLPHYPGTGIEPDAQGCTQVRCGLRAMLTARIRAIARRALPLFSAITTC